VSSRALIQISAWAGLALAGIALSGCGSTSQAQPAVVPPAIVDGAARSVTTVRCINAQADANLIMSATGTGFATADGVVTAAHVVSTCAYTGPGSVSAGPYIAEVSRDDPAHDVAVIAAKAVGPALALRPGLPSTGEAVALLGVAGSANGTVTPLTGTVTDTHSTVTLHAEDGAQETLTDAIVVSVNGVIPGDSGGPAIDGAGRVVGVVEGAGGGYAYLTPVSRVTALAG
jgi:S1-C subfamily serine protease